MARPSDGTVPQAQSRTAMFADLAARLHGVPKRGYDAFFEKDLGVSVSYDGAQAAAKGRRHRSPFEGRPPGPTPRGGRQPSRAQPVFRRWLLIDEHELDLDTSLVRIPGRGRPHEGLKQALSDLAGVRQVIETARDRDLYVVVVFDGVKERKRVFGQLEALSQDIEWDDIRAESFEPALKTWRYLTHKVAGDEDLRR